MLFNAVWAEKTGDPVYDAYAEKLAAIRRPSLNRVNSVNNLDFGTSNPATRLEVYRRSYDLEGIMEAEREYWWGRLALCTDEKSYLSKINPEAMYYLVCLADSTYFPQYEGHAVMLIYTGSLPDNLLRIFVL